MSELITATELAEKLRVRTSTIRDWTRTGIIPAIRVTPKVVRYDAEAVSLSLSRRSERGSAEAAKR